MDDLVTWLRAQLDEDERVARAAGGPVADGAWGTLGGTLTSGPYEMLPVHVVRGQLGSRALSHIARHDPARVLREVEAKRQIVDDCAEYIGSEAVTDGLSARTLMRLALPYADRPGYRAEWRL